MLPRVSVFIATSLDGFIARPDGGIDWLDKANTRIPAGEDCGYHAFWASVDALVMGRHSYEKVLEFDPWPYGAKRIIVLSGGSPPAFPARLGGTVEASREAPRALLERLAGENVRHVYVDGGVTIQGFLRDGLVDDLAITTIPVLLGAGRRLFGDLPADVWLTPVETKAYAFGFVQTRYVVSRG